MNRGQPRTGVSIIAVREGMVLLVRRGQEPSKGLWSLPGGRHEIGETLEEAARRELLEETGLVAKALRFQEIVEPIRRDENGDVAAHYVLAVFRAEEVSGAACAGDDAEALDWFALDRLPAGNMTAGTAELLLRLLS